MDVTCSGDGRTHQIDDAVLADPLILDAGRLLAVCGRVVTAAPMAAPPGLPCPLCTAALVLVNQDPKGPGGRA